MMVVLVIFFFVSIFIITELTLRKSRKSYDKYINKEEAEQRRDDAKTTSKSD